MFCCISPSRAAIDARVPASARDAGGAASAPGTRTHVAAKPTGISVAMCVSQLSDQTSRTRKRAFKRAVARATRAGGAIYKGRWRSAQQLGAPAAASDLVVVHPEPAQPRTQKHPPPTAPPLPGHIKALTWNAGGLGGKTGALFDELQIYANRHPFHILFIQETKWTFTNMWEDSHWVFIHSGSPARDFKQGGVLIMLSRRIVDSGSVRYVEPLPGRLLWVYFRHKGQSFDLLNLYQHAWRDSERIRTLRHRALDTLTKSLQAVSLRSIPPRGRGL